MRNLLVLVAILGGFYHFYGQEFLERQQGAFDESGNPVTLLFTVSECGAPCSDANSLLDNRGIEYEQIIVDQGEEQYQKLKEHGGGRLFPVIVAGNNKVSGFNRMQIISALADSYGWEVLYRSEERAMQNHFDSEGNPLLIMYGTETCGYCRKAEKLFVENNVDFVDLDIEKSSSARSSYNTLNGAGTPLIYIGFKRIGGYNKQKIERAISLL
ncbi:MAG: hypothetical protein KAU29_02765 [Gammaproteobacteria bacterium]|nr:hypothetical protein [Gammaproteobacteria bacterium]